MSRFVRPSKYRHTYGQAAKKENTYDNIKISASAWDTNLCSVNTKYLAVNSQVSGGGAFQVVPLSHTGKVPDVYPLVRAHAAPVLDTAWSNFDETIIASAGEDSRVQITKIDDDALEAAWSEGYAVEDIKPLPTTLSHGGRKAGHVLWHPTAAGILASASADIRIWDVEKQTAQIELQAHPDMVQSLAFNSTGALMATTCKDKKLRLFDVRASTSPVSVAESHTGVKGSRVCWLGNHDRIVTTGFSRMSDRQVFLWNSGNLDKPVKQMTVDTSSGTLMPFWSDNNVLFLAGKGDGNIRYYEYESDDLLYLTEYKSNDPQRGMTFLPRRGLSVGEHEIARAYKVSNNAVEPISFTVPRKSEAFQSDIFPPAPSSKPAMSASEFFSGTTKSPIFLDLETGGTSSGPAPSQPTYTSPEPTPTRSASTPNPVTSTFSKIKEAVIAPLQTDTKPAESPVKQSPVRESPITESPKAPSPKASSPAVDRSNEEDLKKQVASLQDELVERDNMIRALELKVEKLQVAQRKARELFSDV